MTEQKIECDGQDGTENPTKQITDAKPSGPEPTPRMLTAKRPPPERGKSKLRIRPRWAIGGHTLAVERGVLEYIYIPSHREYALMRESATPQCGSTSRSARHLHPCLPHNGATIEETM